MQGKALLNRTRHPSQMEKGVSFFLLFRYYDSCYDVSMSKKYVIQKICHCVILSKKLCSTVFSTR